MTSVKMDSGKVPREFNLYKRVSVPDSEGLMCIEVDPKGWCIPNWTEDSTSLRLIEWSAYETLKTERDELKGKLGKAVEVLQESCSCEYNESVRPVKLTHECKFCDALKEISNVSKD